ncbi:hypothetical protein [Paraburkholderia ferrariae]|uniref:hypothetical protein n=1 Tax=Paraburkholderia ferrariae TaxID=386056 RepID=UPI0012EC3060|nr:hypothetical protein [Paraburkholderia ferrariae]
MKVKFIVRIGKVFNHVSYSLEIYTFILAIISLGISNQASATPEIIESSKPPYFAKIEGPRLVSLTIEPRQLALDMNAENSIRSETNDFKPARYYFPNSLVPRSILSHLSGVYGYARRRDVPIVSSGGDWVISEFFPANSHIPLARFRLLGGKVQRQEQLDSSGKVTKIVLVGWAPKGSVVDAEQRDNTAPLGEHAAWIRVLNVSPTGKTTLVAMAWKASGAIGSTKMDDDPKESELYFGLPDGTRRWNSMDEFARSTGVDLRAEILSGRIRR